MPFWRREKPLHERLAEQGGLTERPPHDPGPRWGEVGIHGVARPRQYDATAVTDAPDVEGDAAQFVVLPDGTLLVEEGPSELAALAEAVEQRVEAPYRAQAVRQDGSTWAIAANAIEVVELPAEVVGDEIDVAVHEGSATVVVDRQRAWGGIPELERLGYARGFRDFVVHAERLDETLWEVRVNPL